MLNTDTITLDEAATELSLAVGQFVRRLRSEASSDELNLSQLSVLARLDRNDGGMTTADLARAEAMKAPSMSAILVSLEQGKFVQRRPHTTDGRQILFALTADGMAARRKRRLAKQEWIVSALAKLSSSEMKELVTATALIRRLGDL